MIPRLIQPIPVEISQINKSRTISSGGVSGRHETFGNVQRDVKFIIQAQVAFGNVEQVTLFNSMLGASERAGGYLVLRFVDLKNLGKTLNRGDKILKIGDITCDYFLLHSKGDPAAHFSAIGGFTLFRMFFGDRNPIKGIARSN